MQLRIARHTNRLREIVSFYRDTLGLVDLGGFEDHAGYSGAFLGVPGTAAHLEFTSGGAFEADHPHPEALIVLYVADDAARRRITERCPSRVVASANPYWDAAGATTLLDPDGFRVVVVPDAWAAEAEERPRAVVVDEKRR